MDKHEEFMKRLRELREPLSWANWTFGMIALGIYDHLPEELREWVAEQARRQRQESRAGK